ncbi:MAG: peptidase domain-containing ABC transporter [Flavobacterium sp.]|uniref:peptidase domain-containing ABC transporter n=1 Tax=Flavobacterium sp. TaxID=239 RepID=UPI0022C83048|nr:peptidase domain-containing ABC transporter [Flavobacterium sp.]MCZ8023862.1 peptidase domain-containing ABC transporter [Cytophagales bacterium]MCZ8332580.1 peptidase domain-containing ABC transporter [Flavobacterium sp.]
MKYFAPHDSIDCGPVCLKMISNYFGKNYSLKFLKNISSINRNGISIYGLSKAAEKIGFSTTTAEVSLNFLLNKASLPCILYWDNNHFVVFYKVKRGRSNYYHIADPGTGKVKLDEENFKKYWLNQNGKGFVMLLEPTDDFYTKREPVETSKGTPFKMLAKYFAQFQGNYIQVIFTFGATSLVAFIFPFLTQSIVDTGLKLRDLSFVALILIFQLFLFVTSTLSDIIRSHLLLHIGSRINISILNDFLKKMLKLPLKFFETKVPGDLMQRIQDHTAIEEFISSSLLTFSFTLLNIIIYSFVLYFYNPLIFFVFLIGSTISIGWTLFFLRWRKSLNYMRFAEMSNSNDKLFEMASQMHEIKINQFEEFKIRQWETLKIRLFNLELSRLSLEQYQRIGSDFFDQIRTILIIFLSVVSVIQQELTLGMMLAISYLIGQLNIPIKELSRLIFSYQSASIALERMNEVYTEKDEGESTVVSKTDVEVNQDVFSGIELKNVSFSYNEDAKPVLKKINIRIPLGKTTAIVGSSGSGKTTLLKLLLRFYQPSSGEIFFNGQNFENYSINWWRGQCGVVMQEGHIFNETIRRNIAMGDETIDNERLLKAIEIANIEDYVLELPLNVETKIGNDGSLLSTGQKQRILIARAIYKRPSLLFLDEATSSLDAKNEEEIMKNLEDLYQGKTVIIIAHRLSTVKSADNIIVLEEGEIIENGNHNDLIKRRGRYFNLIKNQLELGSN